MIKCFIVININDETPEGKFKENKFYIAKISSNNVNTISVMDINKSWVPFKWVGVKDYNYFENYFNIWDSFLIENKKELNKYIPSTKFYE
jgi:hypothetical protein